MNHQPGKLDVAKPGANPDKAANQNVDEGEGNAGNADQVLPAPKDGDRVMDDGKEDTADKKEQIVSLPYEPCHENTCFLHR